MKRLTAIFSATNGLFAAAVAGGIYLPQALPGVKYGILPALTIMLTVTLLRFPRGFFRHPVSLIPGALWGNLMNYIILGNLIIVGSLFLIRNEAVWIGMILVAAVPPAVWAIPLGRNVGADPLRLFSGLAGAHAGALLIIPLIGLAFLKYIPIGIDSILILALCLIVLPLLLSHVAVDRDLDAHLEKYESGITNLCYLVVFYAITAANNEALKNPTMEILLIAAIAAGALTIVIIAIFAVARFTQTPRKFWSALLLFGTLKNYGLAGGIALWIFGAEAALPSLIFAAVMIVYTTALKIRYPDTSRDKT